MVKSTREGEKLRRGPSFASPTSTRSREKEQVDLVLPTCSRGPVKGGTSVDPTQRPNSEVMVSPRQPALILVAPAATTEDVGRKFPNFLAASPWRSKLHA